MKLFVYGTLKKGFSRSSVLAEAEYLGDYTLENAKMYNVHNSYPVVLPSFSSDDVVKGQLYEVTEDHLIVCDSIETGYTRGEVWVFPVEPHLCKGEQALMYQWTFELPEVAKTNDIYQWNIT